MQFSFMRATDPRLIFVMFAAIVVAIAGFVEAATEPRAARDEARESLAHIILIHRAVARVPGPRLILAGGSNVVYGMAARDIGRRLSVPTVNAGMINLLAGYDNYRRFLRSIVGPGDVVVFSDSNWLVAGTGRQALAAQLAEARLAASLANLGEGEFAGGGNPRWPIWTILPSRPMLAQLAAWRLKRFEIPRSTLGDSLDCIPALAIDPLRFPASKPERMRVSDDIQMVAAIVAERHARLLLVLPWTLIEPKERNGWRRLGAQLVEQLAAVAPVAIDAGVDPTVSVWRSNASEFCDSAVHLSASFRAVRSAQIAAWLASRPEIARLRAAARR